MTDRRLIAVVEEQVREARMELEKVYDLLATQDYDGAASAIFRAIFTARKSAIVLVTRKEPKPDGD